MIEINLLPEELKKKEPRFQKIGLKGLSVQGTSIFRLIGAFFAILIVIQVLLFFIGTYGKRRWTAMSKSYSILLPKKAEADSLKMQIDKISKKVKIIDELMVKRFCWSEKLNDLSDSVTPGIWLVELVYDEKPAERAARLDPKSLNRARREPFKPMTEKVLLRYLVISGCATSTGGEDTALIGKFIKSLKSNVGFYSGFSDIELGSIQRDKIDEQEVMRFKITCLFKDGV